MTSLRWWRGVWRQRVASSVTRSSLPQGRVRDWNRGLAGVAHAQRRARAFLERRRARQRARRVAALMAACRGHPGTSSLRASGPATRWRSRAAHCLQVSPASRSARPRRRAPKPRILARGRSRSRAAALIRSPVRCSPTAALRVRPRGSPLTPRLSPRAWCAVRRTTQGNDGTHVPSPRESCRKSTDGSRSRGPM